MTFRALTQEDLPAVQALLGTIDLFPPDMLPHVVAPALEGDPDHHGFVATDEAGQPVALSYNRAEEMAEDVWNMLALGVSAEHQGRGVGRRLVAYTEGQLRARGARMMLVDTSGTEAFAPARAFYVALGYTEVARIPNYWSDGDDKVTFTKTFLTGV